MNKAILWLVFCLSVNGCVFIPRHTEVGKPFNAEVAKDFQIKKTTQADVLTMLGEPFSKYVHEGKETWSYFHQITDSQFLSVDSAGASLTVTFDEHGVMIGTSTMPIDLHH